MYPLIRTKFGIPSTRSVLVPRLRLIERLNAGLDGKLTILSAPAGYGKTTLAVKWLRGVQQKVTWLSLDEGDNNPARFLTYFIAAVQVIDEPFGKETQALLKSPEPPASNILMTTLLNELAAITFPFVLVIDDYQVIQTRAIHDVMNSLVANQPSQMQLVLVTREDPPFPLPRLRASGQVAEIRQEELRFTTKECAEFLETVMNIQVTKSNVAALEYDGFHQCEYESHAHQQRVGLCVLQ